MNLSEQTLLDLLIDSNSKSLSQDFYSLRKDEEGYLSPSQMAALYTNSALLVTIMNFLKDQLWIQNATDKKCGQQTSYEEFITPFFSKELLPILFLKDFLMSRGASKIKKITKDSRAIEKKVISLILERSSIVQKKFLIASLKRMNIHYLQEEKEQEGVDQLIGHQGLQLYRTFDRLDDVFNLDYQLDRDMVVDPLTKERLYERAGVGVQSGYSTILLAMDFLNTKQGGKVIDLGSGYGRVGLVCSLLRPDIDFTGYEYVAHRVDIGNKACSFLNLGDSLNFETQDLSLESFDIPDADVYYLYDPFTKETYQYVLRQIVEISKRKDITIVTKGNARSWLVDLSIENSWPTPTYIDEGNLCIFKTSL
jgi:hypothetical protein